VVCNLAQRGNFGNIPTSLTLTELNVKRLGLYPNQCKQTTLSTQTTLDKYWSYAVFY